MIPYLFASISIIALVLIGISFLLALELRKLMGKGKDTAPIKILLTVIAVNALLGLYSVTALYWKYWHDYLTYVRISDVMLLIIGIILVTSLWKVYSDYKSLIKKHEPGE